MIQMVQCRPQFLRFQLPLPLVQHALAITLPQPNPTHPFACSYDLMVRLQLGIRYSIGRINQPAASGASMLQLGNGSHPALPPAVQAVGAGGLGRQAGCWALP